MIKKTIRHLNRATVIALELAGMLAFFLFFAWLGLIWRLSQGPLELGDFVKTHLESAFHEQLPEFTFKVDRAQLVWGGRLTPFEFEMLNVAIARADETPVFALERLRVQLSKRNLVFGRIVPRVVKLYGPELRVIRQEDGHFTLNVGQAGAGTGTAAPEAAPETESREALVRGLLRQLEERSGLGILDGLHEIDISGAAVRYEDKVLNVSYLSMGSDVTIARGVAGIVSSAAISLDMGESQKAVLRATVAYSWDAKKTTAAVVFSGITPALLAQQSAQLKDFADVNMPVEGSVNIDLDADFRPASARFALGAEAGTFNAFQLYDAPIAIRDFYVRGKFDAKGQQGEIEELKVDLGGPKVHASGKMTMEGGAYVASVAGSVTDMPVDRVASYWPPRLTPDPRLWVTSHLSRGTATKATLEMEAVYNPSFTDHKVALRKLGGKIEFNGVRVNYFPPLTPVLEAAGEATYDEKSMHIEASAGKLEDMKVTKSAIHITDLDKIGKGEHSKIDIAVSLSGPLKTALKVLDSPPLKYPEMLGIKSGSVAGATDVDVSLKFPIHKGLALNEIKIKAEAKLKDVSLPDLVSGMTLTGGPMDLVVDNNSLRVHGNGKLDATPLQFDWTKNFSKQESVASKVTAKVSLEAETLLKFGMPKDMAPQGVMPSTVSYTVSHDKSAALDLKGDLKMLSFAVPPAGYLKLVGAPGQASMTILLKDGKPYRIAGLDVKSGATAAQGDIDLSPGGGFRKVLLRSLVLGDTNISLQADNDKDGYDVRVTGRQLDASSVFSAGGQKNSDAEAAKPVTPLRLNASVQRLLTGKDKWLDDARFNLTRTSWNRLDRLQVDALADGKAISLQYLPQSGGHTLRFEAENAGQALSILGITNSIRGGKLTVEGHPRKLGGPRDLAGTAVIENFKLNDAPVVAKLLNAMSLTGILSLLSGEGLTFKKARVGFAWTDRGQPGQAQNVRMLKLSDGQTSGASLGLTFEGSIDQWKNVYDLRGTIIPVSDINKLLSAIPIIGTVLTAGGEGIIAATYTITGPKEKPDVMVNPLSVLAPGILRKLFFEQ
ncbi:MAG: DUF3971 domain-containing protein [Alphaproteobacteria bacterium]